MIRTNPPVSPVLASLAVVALLAGLPPVASAQEGWDTGTSTNLLIKVNLDEKWFLVSRNNYATRNEFEPFIQYVDLNLGYNLTEHWSTEIGLRYFRIRPGDDWIDEIRPLVNLEWKQTFSGWSVSNRHRLEFRYPEGSRPDRVRYRNETRLIAPFELIPGTGIKPFAEEEFFYSFADSQFDQNWLTGGVRFPIADGIVGKVGYRWVALKLGEDWSHRHVLVTGLLIFF